MAKDQELSNGQTFGARLARWGEKRDFHSKKASSDDDFAGEISAKAFKNVSETSKDDNVPLEKVGFPVIGDLFGLCKN